MASIPNYMFCFVVYKSTSVTQKIWNALHAVSHVVKRNIWARIKTKAIIFGVFS